MSDVTEIKLTSIAQPLKIEYVGLLNVLKYEYWISLLKVLKNMNIFNDIQREFFLYCGPFKTEYIYHEKQKSYGQLYAKNVNIVNKLMNIRSK